METSRICNILIVFIKLFVLHSSISGVGATSCKQLFQRIKEKYGESDWIQPLDNSKYVVRHPAKKATESNAPTYKEIQDMCQDRGLDMVESESYNDWMQLQKIATKYINELSKFDDEIPNRKGGHSNKTKFLSGTLSILGAKYVQEKKQWISKNGTGDRNTFSIWGVSSYSDAHPYIYLYAFSYSLSSHDVAKNKTYLTSLTSNGQGLNRDAPCMWMCQVPRDSDCFKNSAEEKVNRNPKSGAIANHENQNQNDLKLIGQVSHFRMYSTDVPTTYEIAKKICKDRGLIEVPHFEIKNNVSFINVVPDLTEDDIFYVVHFLALYISEVRGVITHAGFHMEKNGDEFWSFGPKVGTGVGSGRYTSISLPSSKRSDRKDLLAFPFCYESTPVTCNRDDYFESPYEYAQ